MSIKRKIIISIQCLLLVLLIGLNAAPAHAQTKQAQIVTTSKEGDLRVLFTFDQEIVDISFISPSGEIKTVVDSDVEVALGDLWATYLISNAEEGAWRVEYNLGRNTGIDYSIIQDDYGLWIQYFNIGQIEDDKVTMSFETDWEEGRINYNYEIYALSTIDEDIKIKLVNSRARSGEEREIDVRLANLSSGNYVFRLDVYYQDGGGEVFDTVISDPIGYNNPNEPDPIEDFKVKVDMGNLTSTIDWSDYANWGHRNYKLEVIEDGQTIYSAILENDITNNSVVFSRDGKTLEIRLSYKDRNIWSSAQVKRINLTEEFMKVTSDEVTNSFQAILSYKISSERDLFLSINDEEGNYNIQGEGELTLDLMEGSNKIYGEIETENLISYIVDTSIYYDARPPEIKLYEDLDGKTFHTDSVAILGKVLGGTSLSIDGQDLDLDDKGEFTHHASLSIGENLVKIESKDVNGNSAVMVLTLYRDTNIISGLDLKGGLQDFTTLIVSLLASGLIIVLSIIFMKKKDKTQTHKTHKDKKVRIWSLILWDILLLVTAFLSTWQFVSRYRFSNSIAFLELAEKSASEAARYLRIERIFGITMGVVLAVLALSILITLLLLKKNKIRKDELGEIEEVG